MNTQRSGGGILELFEMFRHRFILSIIENTIQESLVMAIFTLISSPSFLITYMEYNFKVVGVREVSIFGS